MFSLPLNDLLPDQEPYAVHDDAFELDHVRVNISPATTLDLFDDNDTDALELLPLPELPPPDTEPPIMAPATSVPPPPPPPHAVMIASKGMIVICLKNVILCTYMCQVFI